MINLSDSIKWLTRDSGSTVIARVDSKALAPSALPHVLLANANNINRIIAGEIPTSRYKAVVIPEVLEGSASWEKIEAPVAVLCKSLAHLEHDDIIRIEGGTNRTRVLFKRSFRHNSLLITERCNNYCVMCSQPPRDVDDAWIADELFTIADLIPKDTVDIGITGGEPTLLGEKLLSLIKYFKNQLPRTGLHILSNGRKFSDYGFAKQCGAMGHPDLMFGIPLYGDNYIDHDYVVQAEGGFVEAVRGIANLKRSGVKVEIRCVIHRDTIDNLIGLATFITRNLTFVDHVALMGYEAMGFGKSNAKQLFVLPHEFIRQLNAAIHVLECARIRTSIYNLPLCLVKGRARVLSVQSISDWKNEYLPECEGCRSRHQCTGFFTSTKELYRHHVRPE